MKSEPVWTPQFHIPDEHMRVQPVRLLAGSEQSRLDKDTVNCLHCVTAMTVMTSPWAVQVLPEILTPDSMLGLEVFIQKSDGGVLLLLLLYRSERPYQKQ